MRHGDNVTEKPCGRCGTAIGNRNIHFQDGMWWHKACWDSGVAQLQDAMNLAAKARGAEQAERFGFAPSALTGVPILPNWQGNPFFWKTG